MGRAEEGEPVGALSRRALLIGVAFAVLAAAPSAQAAPARVSAALDRDTVEFADPVTATVTVFLEQGAAPGGVRVHASVSPLTQLGGARVSDTTRAGARTVTYSVRASCLDQRCLSTTGGAKRIALRPAVVEIGSQRVTATWPVLEVRGRVSRADVARTHPPMRSDASPPAVTYRIAPARLALALDAAAALLAAAGLLLAGWTAVSLLRRRRRAAPPSGLGRALALAREAQRRAPPDRRRALGLLARLLDARHPRLAGTADDLAWSAPPPTPDALADLVTRVEHEVSET
jgi:hypothetical protein